MMCSLNAYFGKVGFEKLRYIKTNDGVLHHHRKQAPVTATQSKLAGKMVSQVSNRENEDLGREEWMVA